MQERLMQFAQRLMMFCGYVVNQEGAVSREEAGAGSVGGSSEGRCSYVRTA